MLKKVRPGIIIDVRVSQFFMLGDARVTLRGKEAQVCHLSIESEQDTSAQSPQARAWSQHIGLGEYVNVGKSRIRVEKKHGQVARLRIIAEKGIVIRRQNSLTSATN